MARRSSVLFGFIAFLMLLLNPDLGRLHASEVGVYICNTNAVCGTSGCSKVLEEKTDRSLRFRIKSIDIKGLGGLPNPKKVKNIKVAGGVIGKGKKVKVRKKAGEPKLRENKKGTRNGVTTETKNAFELLHENIRKEVLSRLPKAYIGIQKPIVIDNCPKQCPCKLSKKKATATQWVTAPPIVIKITTREGNTITVTIVIEYRVKQTFLPGICYLGIDA